jgi:SAM-dependent methyltransferase
VTLPPGYFDRLYAAHPDPWRFEQRWYEQRKRALTMAVLPRARFGRAFEAGCSLGLLSAALADRCDELVAIDVSAAAVAACTERLKEHPGARVLQGAVPHDWPAGRFDLVVISEIAYYLADADLDELARRAAGCLSPDGVLLACHWRHPVADYPRSGDDAHRRLAAAMRDTAALSSYRDDDVLLEVWGRDPRSVASREGLV